MPIARRKSSPVLILLLAFSLAACGSSNGSASGAKASGGSSAKPSGPLAGLLPKEIRDRGTLIVGSDVAYAPVEFFDVDGKSIVGIDPDLGAALGSQLGVRLQFQNGTFDGLITSLKSKRIDLVMSAMSDTKKRQAEIDFVDYFTAGTSILVRKGNPSGVKSLADLCGQTIAVQRGTTQDDVATAQAKTCQTAGKPLKVLKFDRDTEALLQVKQGRAVADMNDFPVAAYNAAKSGGLEVTGGQIQAGPYGIGVRKQDTQLRDALRKALQALIDDGEYAKILDKWHVGQGAVTSASVNAGT